MALGFTGCAGRLSSQQPESNRTVGFWFWQGSSASAAPGQRVDALFVYSGLIPIAPETEFFHGDLASQLPAAREYWLVFRFAKQAVPALATAGALAHEVSRLQADASKRHLNLVGVQLDIDSPTDALPQYAAYLDEVRKTLPKELRLSITALLDWFRNGTSVDLAIAETDEFVPQFYDLTDPGSYNGGAAIASKIDAARWGPVFNKFGKRFRVGISTFGRARLVPLQGRATAAPRLEFFGDAAPLDVATNPSFRLETETNSAGELVLNYRATRSVRIGYREFEAGDTLQFILSTPEAIRSAVQSAQQMGGRFAGVVFFRWPGSDEMLGTQPEEALRAAGFPGGVSVNRNRVDLIDGECAAVKCVDVYLTSAGILSANPTRYRIRSSAALEYFLPEPNIPVRMTGPSQLVLSLPPYCARGRLYLGRAVSLRKAEFTVEARE